jgi:glycosyltransferase involved in cell wall biosynthesis
MKNSVFLRKFGILRFASRLFFGKIEQRLLKEFDAIHVINKNALNKFQKWKRTYYIPNWIDTSCFKSSEDRYEKFSVLFSGRKSKGFSEFMEVADNMQGKGIDFFAIGPDIENTNSVRSLGFKTNVEELVRVYSRVHLLLYTSKIDVFPLTLVEAAACKIPIISFPTEAVKGLELPISYARSKKEFTRRILSVYQMWQTRREKYDELADNMRLQAKKYDVNNVFPEFLNMLRKVANINAS